MKFILASLIIVTSCSIYSKDFSPRKEKSTLIAQLTTKSYKKSSAKKNKAKKIRLKKRIKRKITKQTAKRAKKNKTKKRTTKKRFTYKKKTATVYKKVRDGETLLKLLKKNKFTKRQIKNIISSKKIPKHFFLKKGEIYRVNYKKKPHSLSFFNSIKNQSIEFSANKERSAIIIKKPLQLKTKVKTVQNKINGSLIRSIQKKIDDQIMPFRFRDAYVHDFNLKKRIQRGAKYSITYEEKYLDKKFIKYGEILETSLQINGGINKRYFIKSPNGGFFIENKEQKNKPLYAPVNYQHITSLFQFRKHPIKKRYIAHRGIDYALPKGEPIFSVANGIIKRFGYTRGAGNFVVIQHKKKLESYYNHLSTISKNLFVKKKVKAGEIIGTIGCTGLCTKPHLHFALKKRGRFVNPLPRYMKSYSYHQRILAKKFWSSKKSK